MSFQFLDSYTVIIFVLNILFYLYIGIYHGFFRSVKPQFFLNEMDKSFFMKILTRGLYAAKKDESLKKMSRNDVLVYYRKSGRLRFILSTLIFVFVIFIIFSFKKTF